MSITKLYDFYSTFIVFSPFQYIFEKNVAIHLNNLDFMDGDDALARWYDRAMLMVRSTTMVR